MALAEIKARDEACDDIAKRMRQSLDTLDKSDRRRQELDILNEQVGEFESNLEAIKIEIRSSDLAHSDREHYKKRSKELKAILEQLKEDIKFKEIDKDRDELMDGAGPRIHDVASENGLIQHGDDVLAASKQSLQNSVVTVTQTAAIGKDITTKLQSQTQQMSRQLDDLYEIENTVDRAAAIMKRMARKIASDKYVWVMVFLVFAAIVFIIVYKNVNKSADVAVPNSLVRTRL